MVAEPFQFGEQGKDVDVFHRLAFVPQFRDKLASAFTNDVFVHDNLSG